MKPVNYLGEKISLRPELAAICSSLDDEDMAMFLQFSEGICYFSELKGFFYVVRILPGKKKNNGTVLRLCI